MEGSGSMNPEMPRPPLRMMFTLVLVAAIIFYETNPNFQSWANYQLVRARAWAIYARDWLAWKQRQRGT